jgi:predicted DNA binding CopG/RHH family protein/uncharacterized DUF497 family protein
MRREGFEGFDWDAGNREKCQNHGLTITEIEHVLIHAETLIRPDEKTRTSEERLLAIGRTSEQRYSFIAFTVRAAQQESGYGQSSPATCINGRSRSMRRKSPPRGSGKKAEDLLEKDLSDLIRAEKLEAFPFEYRPKRKSINLRVSDQLLNAVRAEARRHGLPYQRYIRQTLEAAVRKPDK